MWKEKRADPNERQRWETLWPPREGAAMWPIHSFFFLNIFPFLVTVWPGYSFSV